MDRVTTLLCQVRGRGEMQGEATPASWRCQSWQPPRWSTRQSQSLPTGASRQGPYASPPLRSGCCPRQRLLRRQSVPAQVLGAPLQRLRCKAALMQALFQGQDTGLSAVSACCIRKVGHSAGISSKNASHSEQDSPV